MQKEKLVFNHPPGLGRLIPSTQKKTGRRPKKTKTMPIGKTKTGTKTRLSFIIPHLLTVSLKSRPSRKTNVMKAVKEVI